MIYKTISIIIPYHDETPSAIFPLLSSINNQVGIDFNKVECILVNDGADNLLPEDFLANFNNLNIRTLMCSENKGPGVTRQIGMDNASGDYLMFCDADDILHSVAVLGLFFNELSKSSHDIITTPWLEELYGENGYTYLMHDDEATWMHGKLFRRQFITGNNIRFHESLRVHEDSYFLSIAFAMTEKKVKIPITTYVWKFNPNSITRRNNASYSFDSMPTYIEAMEASLAEVEKLARHAMEYKVTQFTMYIYFMTQNLRWSMPENNHYKEDAERAFKAYISKYSSYFYNTKPEFINTLYAQERSKNFNGCMEKELFSDWTARMFD